jgi:hypothetical protein
MQRKAAIMTQIDSSTERLVGAMAKAQQHWRQQRGKATNVPGQTPTGFTIALTREVGARGTTVARELATRLGWQVYDHELLELVAQEMSLRTSLLESVDARNIFSRIQPSLTTTI